MNKLTIGFSIFSALIISALVTFYMLLMFAFDSIDTSNKIYIGVWVGFFVLMVEINSVATYLIIKRRREQIKRSFDYYIEDEVSKSGTGVVIYNDNYEIIWGSNFIEDRFGEYIIGKKLSEIAHDFSNRIALGEQSFKFGKSGFVYEARINIEYKNITIKDITNEDIALKQYNSEKLVIGEMEIDNYQQFHSTISEEEMFKAQAAVIKMLDKLSDEYNFIYKQYVNGKYIFFTNKTALEALKNRNFTFIEEIRKVKLTQWSNLTISIGLGYGTTNQKDLLYLARNGLTQAQARGGDQIALMEYSKKPEYFGSRFEIAQTTSRIKIKQIARMFEQKLTDSKIKNVIVYGHKLADLDAIGAIFGIVAVANTYSKPFLIGNTYFDTTTQKMLERKISKTEWSFFTKPAKAVRHTNANTLVVVVDTAEVHRIENEDAFLKANPNNIFIFDHHRVSKLPSTIPKTNIYIDTLASSASEIIVEAINFMSRKIKLTRRTSQFLLNGIFLDTANFTKATSSRTYQAASFLENNGASSNEAAEIMKHPENAFDIIQTLLNNVQEIKPGYFLSSYEGTVPTDIISMTADEILRTQGRKAAFVIAKSIDEKNKFKMSARGANTNVQKIAEAVGGGGHFAAAAATSSESLPLFVDNIRQAIVSAKEES